MASMVEKKDVICLAGEDNVDYSVSDNCVI